MSFFKIFHSVSQPGRPLCKVESLSLNCASASNVLSSLMVGSLSLLNPPPSLFLFLRLSTEAHIPGGTKGVGLGQTEQACHCFLVLLDPLADQVTSWVVCLRRHRLLREPFNQRNYVVNKQELAKEFGGHELC